ncbi:MAG: 50S ribosomal protein L10 [Clostridia bacterium]|nr:50S ribosomal protein L10 [Clostridia bacterium]
MSANFENKKLVVEEIKNHAKDAKCIVLVDYRGLTVADVTELRNNFRSQGCVYKVYKNRLMKIAFEELGINFEPSLLEGTTAVAFSDTDVVAPAKIAVDGENKFKVMRVKAGYAEGKFYNEAEIKNLASIPSKEILVAQLLGMLTNPMRGLAVAINEIAKKNA